MKVVLLFLLVSPWLVQARPLVGASASSKDATILRYNSENDGLGSYKFSYETSDGQIREEEGQIQNKGTDNEYVRVTGSFSFISPEGKSIFVRYMADENGFVVLPSSDPGQVAYPPAVLASLVGAG